MLHCQFRLVAGLSGNPRLECLARKVEWGFPYAIFDMTEVAGDKLAPTLRSLSNIGENTYRTSRLGTVRGNAQTALAIIGDKDEFEAIVRELDTEDYADAVSKLQLVGGQAGVEALIQGFDSAGYEDFQARNGVSSASVANRRVAISSALASLIVFPPQTKAPAPETWHTWWQKNEASVAIRKTAQWNHE